MKRVSLQKKRSFCGFSEMAMQLGGTFAKNSSKPGIATKIKSKECITINAKSE